MTEPVTTKTFENICLQWTDSINRHENAIQMWLPLAGAHMRIKQFIADSKLQTKLFGAKKPQFLFIDANELTDFAFDDFEEQVMSEFTNNSEQLSLDEYLKLNTNQLAIFLTGFDTALTKGNMDTLNKIASLTQKYQHFSIILCIDFDVISSSILSKHSLKSTIFQNILYTHLYTYEDSIQFFSYLGEKWHCTFDVEKTEFLAKKIGGHYWLLKEAARILRAHPQHSVDEVLTSTTLVAKGLALLDRFNEKDRTSILAILSKKTFVKTSDYLLQTKLITDNNLNLSYWYQIKKYMNSEKEKYPALDLYFTAAERDIFELLLDKREIVSREEIAKTIWQKNWQERYSDWAIDQIVHRIRKKLLLAHAPYEVITKKGEGFILNSL